MKYFLNSILIIATSIGLSFLVVVFIVKLESPGKEAEQLAAQPIEQAVERVVEDEPAFELELGAIFKSIALPANITYDYCGEERTSNYQALRLEIMTTVAAGEPLDICYMEVYNEISNAENDKQRTELRLDGKYHETKSASIKTRDLK